MYNENFHYYDYRPHHPSHPTVPPGTVEAAFISMPDIQLQFDLGRRGHCFKSYWGGKERIFKLNGISSTGLVDIDEDGQPGSVSNIDMVGLYYLGVTCPSSSSWPGPGQTTGPTSGWPQCGWVMTPWGMKWICY